ncbi:unnamed protein product [Blumeria hordei]|uniref:Uncharacterized protein n=1 Tax=Blumeria hordei TaxID=2867405 RepID=A0A383UGA5_BLUHO|nr:unnamed protein product [Blumeria hordei]
MVAKLGEDIVATLLADVHYFYGPPNKTSSYDKFDKASLVCLVENATIRRARIEITSQSGLANHNLLDGYLDKVLVHYSYSHSNLITLSVDQSEGRDWYRPVFDEGHESGFLHDLYTVDLYFWKHLDAIQLLDAIRRVVPPDQIKILDEPDIPLILHNSTDLRLTQEPENATSHNSTYGHRDTQEPHLVFPRPPISATPPNCLISSHTPLAYDPAAPAAPEKIVHREKTPPPEDNEDNILTVATSSELYQPSRMKGESTFSRSPLQSHYSGSTHEALQQAYKSQHSIQLSTADTHFIPPFQPLLAPSGTTNQPSFLMSYQAPEYQNHLIHSTPNPTYSSTIMNPCVNFDVSSDVSGINSRPSLQTKLSPSPDESNLKYTHIQDVHSIGFHVSENSLNQRAYRPAEHDSTPKSAKPLRSPGWKLEERAAKLERGVGSLFRKLEKKIG